MFWNFAPDFEFVYEGVQWTAQDDHMWHLIEIHTIVYIKSS